MGYKVKYHDPPSGGLTPGPLAQRKIADAQARAVGGGRNQGFIGFRVFYRV